MRSVSGNLQLVGIERGYVLFVRGMIEAFGVVVQLGFQAQAVGQQVGLARRAAGNVPKLREVAAA